MAKKMLIDATHAEETRVVVVDGNKVEEFDFESENKRQLAGNIYLAKVTRVEPSLQAAFIDYGGNRHGFLAFAEIHPDYYQIPVADRQALLDEEQAAADAERNAAEAAENRNGGAKAARTHSDDAVEARDAEISGDEAAEAQTAEIAAGIPGMDVVDVVGDDDGATSPEESARDDRSDGRDEAAGRDATRHDESIESVADDDVADEVRPARKPKAKRYKIQEVVKVRQILLVQVVKEERGNKGAALTTYLSLAGRYCVLMPNTARGGGISRKITNAADRKKLKDIAASMNVPKGAGLIIRTAGAKRTKTEIKRDYEYLQRMWEQIRELTLKSVAPAPIYEEGNLIKRSIRDLYNREIDEVWVEGPEGYRTAKDFMKMIMPSHAKNVKHYTDQLPLLARHQVESYLGAMFNPTVQLPSGGYIVIGVTEALVAIDVNSGKATREGSIEETAYKTNMEAAEEVARQLRLRDLAGLIVIDFIDMEDRKHNANVEKHFKDKLKTDRARIQVGKISGFGLLEMSRQRLRPGMLEATTQPCPHCHGTGLLRSDDSVALAILRQLEEEGTRKKTKEVCVTVPVAVCNYLMNHKREHVALIEARYGMAVRLEADPALVSPDFKLDKLKHQTIRTVEPSAAITASLSGMDLVEEEEPVEVDETEAPPAPDAPDAPQEEAAAEEKPKKKRRRRRRRGGSGNGGGDAPSGDESARTRPEETRNPEPQEQRAEAQEHSGEAEADQAGSELPAEEAPAPKRRRTRSRSKPAAGRAEPAASGPVPSEVEERIAETAPVAPATPEAPAEPASESRPAEPAGPEEPVTSDEPAAPETAEREVETLETKSAVAAPDPADREPEMAGSDAEADEEQSKPKRRGWWSLRK